MSMILYNIRHRGPYEYDKFVLNILQTCNEVSRLVDTFKKGAESRIAEKQKKLDDYLEAFSKEDGMLQELMLKQEKIGEGL